MFLTAVLLLMGLQVIRAQTIAITDPDFDQAGPLDCLVYNNGSITNFEDDGGGAGDYSANFSDTIVLCPDLVNGSKVTVTFATNAGYVWDVHESDSVYLWDGPSTSAPFLGAYNSATNPNGFSTQASFYNNPSGCLTVAFQSDGADEAAGWKGNVSCGNPPQPFEPHMQAYLNGPGGDSLNLPDTGMIRLCLGDSILYVGSADFPFSLENAGTGYSQNDTNVTYKWFFSNGFSAIGDSVWFTPTGNAGYVVTLQVTDQFPNTEQIVSFVRVAPRIDFSRTHALNDSICEGDTVVLIAGITNQDTVGVSSTVAVTEVGGSFAGLTYLPDGSGVNYETTIAISGFGAGQTLTTGMDIMRLSMTIEHSFLGDLEMMLTCPNGDSVVIFNSFTGQGIGPAFAGGFGGGGYFLGDAWDSNIGNPGVGWTYSFSDTLAVWGDFAAELAAGNTVPTFISSGQALNPDSIYLPEQTFMDLVGCPINGEWKITVRDNLGIDDGYIFDWAIFFNPYINPNFESYTSTLLDGKWFDGDSINDPVIGNFGDTLVFDVPDSSGTSYYTFQVLDDFGCLSDTTIEVYQTARPQPLTLDTGTCDNEMILSVSESDSVFWYIIAGGGAHIDFLPSPFDSVVTVATDSLASYLVGLNMYKDACVFEDTVDLHFYADNPANLFSDTMGCFGDSFLIVPATNELNNVYQWEPGGASSQSVVVTQSGTYYLTVSGCNTVSDSIKVTFYKAPKINLTSLVCDSIDTLLLTKAPYLGHWEVLQSEFDTSLVSLTDLGRRAALHATGRGFVTVAYYDSICQSMDSVPVLFELMPRAYLSDTIICAKDAPLALQVFSPPTLDLAYRWSTGETDSIIYVQEPGLYSVKVSNQCHTLKLEQLVKFKDCEYFLPNIITPDGDGVNDVFSIKAYEYYDDIQLVIYNRWGQFLYEGTGSSARWDGTTPSGDYVTDGTYFYHLVIDGEVINGSFTVIAH